MKPHREWYTIIAYFKHIPINVDLVRLIEELIEDGENVLLMIKKENPEDDPQYTEEEKFKALCETFPEETKNGKIIISKVPDIKAVLKFKI